MTTCRDSQFHGSLKTVEDEKSETTVSSSVKSKVEHGPHHLDSPLNLSDKIRGLPEQPPCDQIHQKSTGSPSKTVHTERDLIASNHIAAASAGKTEKNCIESDSSPTCSDGPVCILCDEPATVRLLPCGHEIICLMCSKRAKKCLQCKVNNNNYCRL